MINSVHSVSDNEVEVKASITFSSIPEELQHILPRRTRTQDYTFIAENGGRKFCAMS